MYVEWCRRSYFAGRATPLASVPDALLSPSGIIRDAALVRSRRRLPATPAELSSSSRDPCRLEYAGFSPFPAGHLPIVLSPPIAEPTADTLTEEARVADSLTLVVTSDVTRETVGLRTRPV